jgi:hypothetical protein
MIFKFVSFNGVSHVFMKDENNNLVILNEFFSVGMKGILMTEDQIVKLYLEYGTSYFLYTPQCIKWPDELRELYKRDLEEGIKKLFVESEW